MDENIEASARGAYVFRKTLAEEGLSVEASNGVLTLRGSVALALQRELAGETAAAVPGVERVDNQIEVKPAPPGGAGGELATLRVKTVLGLHKSCRPCLAGLEFKSGVLTLRGEVRDGEQRRLAAEYAADLDGVERVVDELTVVPQKEAEPDPAQEARDGGPAARATSAEPAAEVDDASVVAHVRVAFRNHRSTRSLRPGVEASEGIVTLTGEAASVEERDRAGRLCGDLLGVRAVLNKITVQNGSSGAE